MSENTTDTIEQAEVYQEPTPAEQAEHFAAAATLAADDAEAARDAAGLHAALAEEARQRGAILEHADEASAAVSIAMRARAYAEDAATACSRIEHAAQPFGADALGPYRTSDVEPGGELDRIQAAHDQALSARDRASAARHVAEGKAKQASDGVDWLRYHLDGQCKGWRERVDV